MRLVKFIPVVLVVAGALVWLGAGSASATVLCETTTTPCNSPYLSGTVLDASVTSGTTAILETTGGTVLDTCAGGTVKGTTANDGGAGEAVWGSVSSLTFSSCTRATATLKTGEFEIQQIAGTDNGTLISRNAEVTINSIFGTCVYGTASGGTDLGTLKGGASPTIEVNAVVPKLGGESACPSHMRLTASYTLAEPKPLYVEPDFALPTVLCETTTTPCNSPYLSGTVLDASVTSGTTAILETTGGTVLDTCTAGTVKGTTANDGGEEAVRGSVSSLVFSGCTRTTTVLKAGEFEIRRLAETENGTLLSSEAEVEVNTVFGTCVYGTASGGTDLGILKGGASPTIEVNGVMPKISGNFACPPDARLTADYTLTEPKPLYVEGT